MENIIHENNPYILYNQLVQLNRDGTYTIKEYKKDILRLKNGLEKPYKDIQENIIKKPNNIERERYDSLSRTKSMILDYASNNKWETFYWPRLP